ncbi:MULTISPECIES: alkaline phosphatase [Clostridia]|uniref:Alkaline phosphatase n=1 Tax=Clostridium saudiense TaxID=1414720 RepID=A0ABS2FBN1_9CLOT|nr:MULTISPECIES: alkaline phosphatase [Clostridiaceae]MBM6817784.1 alkaline phosphatase [Clostridium saudiense]
MSKRIRGIIAAFLVVAGVTTNIHSSKSDVAYANERGKTKNVIMLIADGMSTEAITLARHTKGDSLAMDEISVGSVITSWANGPITDSAPGGTVYAAGEKTNNKYIGTSVNDTPMASILEGAESVGKATGIVATSEITHATPGDFTAHTNNRKYYNQILQQQINQDMEVVLGGGFNKPSGFSSEVSTDEFESYYEEQVNNIKEEGFDFITTKDQLTSYDGDKLWGSFADADLKYDFDRQSDNDNVQPSLAEMTNKAIEVLNKDEDGFFLMVEGSKVDWAAHANNTVGIVSDILAFDEAVKAAIEFAKTDGNTVVVVTTDHGNSGITIGSSYYNENIESYDKATYENTTDLLKNATITEERFNEIASGKSNDEIKAIAKKYYGIDLNDEELAIVKGEQGEGRQVGIREVIARRVGIGYTTGGHTGEQIYLGVYAPSDVELLEGVVDNTEVNKYMQRVLFGEEILSSYTKEIYQDGEVILNKIEGTKASIDETIKYSPKLTIERLGNVIEVDLYTNNYRINGEEKELKTVVPYINGKYFIPQELIDIVLNLKENTNSKDIEEKVEENIVDIIEEVITDINSEEVNEIQEETAVYNQDTIKEDIEEVGGEN